jgi:hypothetical protein
VTQNMPQDPKSLDTLAVQAIRDIEAHSSASALMRNLAAALRTYIGKPRCTAVCPPWYGHTARCIVEGADLPSRHRSLPGTPDHPGTTMLHQSGDFFWAQQP